jgi:threonine/homoserine/homoserine lactone efflux protein
MLDTLPAFLPVAAVLTLTPGIATALVVRSAVRGGRREAGVCGVCGNYCHELSTPPRTHPSMSS